MLDYITVDSNKFTPYNIVFDKSYDDLENQNIFNDKSNRRICIVSDTNVAPIYMEVVKRILLKKFKAVTSIVITAGEEHKTLETVNKIYKHLIENSYDRNDMLAALGGGVVGDITGFCAATYLRGIKFIQLPTTLLSQVDSSVGGKTGVDFEQYKNMIGAFYQPALVYINIKTLDTLENEQYISGMGEVLKYGLIKDREFFDWLDKNHSLINDKNEDILIPMIKHCCEIKRDVVQRDPKEKGERALLNFGHTIGHAIEKLMDFKLFHGQCVSLGMIAASYVSLCRNLISDNDFNLIVNVQKKFNMLTEFDKLSVENIIEATKHDKKMDSGQIRFILLKKIGDAYVDDTVNNSEMENGINILR
ncbi:3-dehydroquinate synthase [Acetitomaculum ruminis DSM 5522]|uniref:3-dehydroquinate synthase n=1 Tax=Acetitomaculum ruminis DSM 5522 TaxID=1120918 RepID=A0A1I0V6J0_9FIRM|nr:3-dehydroquinate synthase [Acetitomaculum ruminis]SFA71703.1 3-dehydroquinate synthase [Acetitomaculum ruminis DSM 5522]